MRKKQIHAKTDPELLRQLEDGAASQSLIQAVFTLRSSEQKAVSPEQVEKLTQKVLDRVARIVGTPASEVNIFRNLGAFVVSAQAPFIRALLTDPDIASAMANRQSKQMMIPPHRKRPLI